jgi:hypothetical protein
LTLYSQDVDFFVFLPLSILPILLCVLFFLVPRSENFQWLDCVKAPGLILTRMGLVLTKYNPLSRQLNGGSFHVSPTIENISIGALVKKGIAFHVLPMRVTWKGWVALFLFASAICATFFGVGVGTAFFVAGLLSMLVRPFPMRQTFLEKFPLPTLLEIFGAIIFFYALQNSGVSAWAATWVHGWPSQIGFFLCAQIAACLMPRPLAFAILFSVAQVAFDSSQLFLAGAVIAFGAAIPFFSIPLNSILFISITIPACFFWPTR